MSERLISREIPLPSSKMILFDLDKTLIDRDYNFTDDRLWDEVKKVQDLGWSLGLNSDTALEPLMIWRDRLGFNGPVIAERGSVLWLPNGREIVIGPGQEYFDELKMSLVTHMVTNKINFLHGDVTQFLRNNPTLKEMTDDRLVLLQAYRRCSLNFYGRFINGDGELVIDNNLVAEMIEVGKNAGLSSDFELEEDFNPDYGIYIVSPSCVNKRMGVMSLLSEMGIDKVGMVGDSTTDIVGSDIALQYAVGNAKPELKKVADYVCESDYGSGVFEILESIR